MEQSDRSSAPATAPPTAGAVAVAAPKLIEFGWDIPGPRFLHDNLERMQDHPFDGLLFNLVHENPRLAPEDDKEDFAGEVPRAFDVRRWREDELRIDLLRGLDWGRFGERFPFLWSTNDKGMDWFDDDQWRTIGANLELFAAGAQAIGAKGIAFDLEDYGGHAWWYRQQPGHERHSFEAYQGRVRQRGAEFMTAVQTGFPGAAVMTLGLLSWCRGIVHWGGSNSRVAIRRRLERRGEYGLWPAFVAGMLEAAPAESLLIDGHEHAYYFARAQEFDAVTAEIRGRTLLPLIDGDVWDDYPRHVRVGHGIYVDGCMNFWPDEGYFGSCLESDEQRLRLLEHNVYHLLRTTDPGAASWVYSESMSWWTGQVRDDVRDAVFGAKRKFEEGRDLGFEIEAIVDAGERRCAGG